MNLLVPAVGFGLVTASILALAGVGFTLQFSVTTILNLAYGDIMTAAAFVGYLVTSAGLGIWAALAAGAVFGGGCSALLIRCLSAPFTRAGPRQPAMMNFSLAVSLLVKVGRPVIWSASFF